mgnify:CR=1 FL=1
MNWMERMRIGTRLAFGFGALLLISALMAGFGIYRLQSLQALANRLGTIEAERMGNSRHHVGCKVTHHVADDIQCHGIDPMQSGV